ncbi:hypothetical protein [Novosphingobium sp. MMS21-SN21R]|uniref:hypothetical protein n=1 Tax=Novosphingobium sp. MMS21-SN21R TaxID=2969298 RepID=UPI0028864634|nr:hypothetical protein [Novosphingobium sp. MMS21-SN21R]MDT0507440.1 hypothetical protein [Novosphingobium sp. MMS21-SN21R]
MASRNRIEMSNVIFRRLIDHAAIDGTIIANGDKGRFIKRLSEADAELMAKADVRGKRKITRQMRAVMFEHGAQRFFALFGFASSLGTLLQMPEGLAEIDPTPGMFGIAITEAEIMPRATSVEIRDVIEAEYSGLEGYEGHELTDVAGLFPPVVFAEADVNYPYTMNIDRVLGAMVAATYLDGPIALSEDALNAAGSLFTAGPSSIPFEIVLQGILSISWSGLYVELYRCVEQLYPVPRLSNLINRWASTQSLNSLAELLRDSLGWRPREDESLIKLIKECPDQVANDLIASFELELDEKSIAADAAGRQVYGMRNSLVHFRGNTVVVQPNDEKWNAIVVAMIALVAETYNRFGELFHAGATAPTSVELVEALTGLVDAAPAVDVTSA